MGSANETLRPPDRLGDDCSPCRIARRDRFLARFGDPEKRVPVARDRRLNRHRTVGGQGSFADGGFFGFPKTTYSCDELVRQQFGLNDEAHPDL